MGLTLKRFAFGGLILAATLLPLRKDRTIGPAATNSGRGQRMDSLYSQLRSARLSWSAFELRDSAVRILASTRTGSGYPAITLQGFAGVRSLPDADSAVAEIWSTLGTSHPDIRTSVLVYNNRPYSRSSYSGAFIARRTDGMDCVAIAPASVDTFSHQISIWRRSLAEAIAPCALFAAFGVPGRSVGSWLAATGYAPAQSNHWLVPGISEYTYGPWVQWSDRDAGRGWPEEMFGWMRSTGTLDYALFIRPPYAYGATGIRCINGDQGACVTGVLHSGISLPTEDSVPPGLTLTAWRTIPAEVTVGTVRPPSPAMVGAIITEFGRDKFQKFWSSDQPFEAAFQSAFGISLGAWSAKWAAREWAGSVEAKHGNPEILLGVTLKPSWFALLVGWTVLAVAIAAGVAKRRTA